MQKQKEIFGFAVEKRTQKRSEENKVQTEFNHLALSHLSVLCILYV